MANHKSKNQFAFLKLLDPYENLIMSMHFSVAKILREQKKILVEHSNQSKTRMAFLILFKSLFVNMLCNHGWYFSKSFVFQGIFRG